MPATVPTAPGQNAGGAVKNAPPGAAAMALAPLASVDRSALRWLRSSDEPLAFTLSSGPTAVATLRWAVRRGSLAIAESAQGTWTFKRTGFLSPRLTVRPKDATAELAHLTPHLRHHLLEVTGGGSYRLRRAGLLLPAWSLTTGPGREVLHVEPVPEGRKLAAGAVLVETDVDAAEALVLVLLTWYFIVLAWFEDEAVEALAPFEGPDAPESVARRSPPVTPAGSTGSTAP